MVFVDICGHRVTCKVFTLCQPTSYPLDCAISGGRKLRLCRICREMFGPGHISMVATPDDLSICALGHFSPAEDERSPIIRSIQASCQALPPSHWLSVGLLLHGQVDINNPWRISRNIAHIHNRSIDKECFLTPFQRPFSAFTDVYSSTSIIKDL